MPLHFKYIQEPFLILTLFTIMNWLTPDTDRGVPQEAQNTAFICNAKYVPIELAILKRNKHHAASVTQGNKY